ncbi:hypothetical protein BDR07DRAFT_832522 [Suillus spraguei]|nr:hypothetical protein BDR07DRAFT_832522 [Suillus spraguei]
MIPLGGYFVVAGFIVVTYDWVLTFGQEAELVWVSAISCQRNTHEDTLNFRVISGQRCRTRLVANDSPVSRCALPWNLLCCASSLG